MDKIDIFEWFEFTNIDDYITKYIKQSNANIEISYISNFVSTKIIRDIISNICISLNIDNKNISRIILVIDEMNNNAIEYWSKNWDINKIRFKAQINNNIAEINIEVQDSWKWEKAKTALEMETLRAHQLKLWYLNHDSIRWRWLFMIIVNLADRLYFRDAKDWWLIVWIRKRLKIWK